MKVKRTVSLTNFYFAIYQSSELEFLKLLVRNFSFETGLNVFR